MARRVSQECAKRKTPKRGSGALEWVRDAWRDWVNGERNWSALARRYGRERRTIKANVIRYSRALAADLDKGPDPLAAYVAGLEADLELARKVAGDVKVAQQSRNAALKHVTDIREKLAAAYGIITKREGREHSGRMGVDVGFSDMSDDELRELVGT